MEALLIEGVIPPMVTPFKESGEVDYAKHERNLEKWNREDLSGYLVLGSNSETAFLSEGEQRDLIQTTVRLAAKDRLILAGTGKESATETVRSTNEAAQLGVAAALVLTPFFYSASMTDDALIEYFALVADRAEIPILIYNVPKFTHKNVSLRVVRELSGHPNIIGMKDSSGDIPQLAAFLRVVDPNWNLMVGTAAAWFPALTLGVRAGIFALANCAPGSCAAVQRAFSAGNLVKARETYLRILPVNTAVTATYGIAGLKHAADLMGYEGGAVRSPLLPLSPEAKDDIGDTLREAGLLM